LKFLQAPLILKRNLACETKIILNSGCQAQVSLAR
jgi:hypothetical protein